MAYKPKPIETSGVTLSEEIRKLTELLAENNHDLWAQKRFVEGWTHGPNRNDPNKTHPDLVPYADLSESEKDYDRTTAMETLKTNIEMGYRVEPPAQNRTVHPHPPTPPQDEALTATCPKTLTRKRGPNSADSSTTTARCKDFRLPPAPQLGEGSPNP